MMTNKSNKIVTIIEEDEKYNEITKKFNKKDGLLALLLIVFHFVSLFMFARRKTSSSAGIVSMEIFTQVMIFASILLIVVILLLVIRKQKPNTIGFTFRKIIPSILSALLLISIFILFIIILKLVTEGSIKLNNAIRLQNWVLYISSELISVAILEEVIYRGFAIPRLRSLFKNRWAAMIVSGILFSLVHTVTSLTIWGTFDNWGKLVYTFFFHIIASLLYEKNGNLNGSILLHFLGNVSSFILI